VLEKNRERNEPLIRRIKRNNTEMGGINMKRERKRTRLSGGRATVKTGREDGIYLGKEKLQECVIKDLQEPLTLLLVEEFFNTNKTRN